MKDKGKAIEAQSAKKEKHEGNFFALLLALVKSAVFLGAGICAMTLIMPFLGGLFRALGPGNPFTPLVIFSIYALWALLLLWFTATVLEKRSLASYGLGLSNIRAVVLEFYDGALIGSSMVTVVTIILLALGCYSIIAWNSDNDLAILVPSLIMAALYEEILFRGYVLQTLERASNTGTAVLISSALFGAVHMQNFEAGVPLLQEVLSCTTLGLDAGVLFCTAYLLTRRLWLPVGLHAFWNIFEGPVFGQAVSGRELGAPLLISKLSGHSALTGGVFGPEASAVELIVCLIIAVVLWRRAAKKPFNKI